MEGTPASLLEAASTGTEAAATALAELAAGRSMCAIARTGESFPAAKYHEGRMVAFGEAARLLRRGGTRTDLERVAQAWSEQRAIAGPGDWSAYRHGGVDALAELLALDARGGDEDDAGIPSDERGGVAG